ncbi:hypothetical protein M5K25_000008 [Dendrobium thyrsiflorum]|uniref:Uncharacterized protein n=1 Tax=Dendrobium thyrsiflorum TaxID=117978 RepID=A0ABD0VT88_DENTH
MEAAVDGKIPLFVVNPEFTKSFGSADLRDLAEERAKGRKLPSQRASSRRCFRSKCRNFRSNRATSSKERSRTATKGPKNRLARNSHSCEGTKPNSNDEIEKVKANPEEVIVG